MGKLNVGIIGIGRMGTYHVSMFKSIENAKIQGVFDENAAQAKKISEQFQVEVYNDLDQLIKDSSALVLASPTRTHYEIAKKILTAGKHLLIEKPLAPSLNEANELVELARKKNLILHVGHVERFNGAVIELFRFVNKPNLWEAKRIGPEGRITDVGVIWDLMIHDVDICLRALNCSVKDVNTYVFKRESSRHEDVANTSILFENGCVGNFIASRISQKKDRMLTISQKDEYLHLDFTNQELSIHREASSQIKTSSQDIRYSQHMNFERVYVVKKNPLELEDRYFIEAILDEKSSYEENQLDIKTIEVTEKIIKSIHS